MSIAVLAIGGTTLGAVLWQHKSASNDTPVTRRVEFTSAELDTSPPITVVRSLGGAPAPAETSRSPPATIPNAGEQCLSAPTCEANEPVIVYLPIRYDDADNAPTPAEAKEAFPTEATTASAAVTPVASAVTPVASAVTPVAMTPVVPLRIFPVVPFYVVNPPLTGGIEAGNAFGRIVGSPGARTAGPAGVPPSR